MKSPTLLDPTMVTAVLSEVVENCKVFQILLGLDLREPLQRKSGCENEIMIAMEKCS